MHEGRLLQDDMPAPVCECAVIGAVRRCVEHDLNWSVRGLLSLHQHQAASSQQISSGAAQRSWPHQPDHCIHAHLRHACVHTLPSP